MALHADPNFYTLQGLFQHANTVTGNLAMNVVMLALWVIFFQMGKSYSNRTAMIGASFVCAIISFFLAMAGLINPILITVFVIATAVGLMLG